MGEHKQFVARLAIWNECGPECEGRNVLVEGRTRSLLAEGSLVVATSTSTTKQHCFLFSDAAFLAGTPRVPGRRLSLLKALDKGAGGGGLGHGLGLIGAAAERRRRSVRKNAAATADGVPHSERPPLAAIVAHQLSELLSVPSAPAMAPATGATTASSATREASGAASRSGQVLPITVVTANGTTLHLSAPSHSRRHAWLSSIAAVTANKQNEQGGEAPVEGKDGDEQGEKAALGRVEEDDGEESAY